MRLACFDDYRLSVVVDDAVHDVTGEVDQRWHGTPYAMTQLVAEFDALRPAIDAAVGRTAARAVTEVNLLPPLPAPTHLFAAPLNYHAPVDDARVRGGASGVIELPDPLTAPEGGAVPLALGRSGAAGRAGRCGGADPPRW